MSYAYATKDVVCHIIARKQVGEEALRTEDMENNYENSINVSRKTYGHKGSTNKGKTWSKIT